MLILSIDTASPYSSAALCEDEKKLAGLDLDTGNTHSETLLPAIDSLLALAGRDITEIELFALTSCPGSFTGVRIGAAEIKGLAFGDNKPCVGVSTLEALAYNLKGFKGIISPVMDARRGQFYNALFKWENGELIRLTEDRLISASDLDKELKRLGRVTYLCGDGYKLAREKLSYSKIQETPYLLIKENAYSAAQLAWDTYKKDPDKSYLDKALYPGYLRASQAERELKEKNNK